jgi:hypothetical protein
MNCNYQKSLVILSHNLPNIYEPVRLSFEPFIFSQPAVFFSHNKSTNSTFRRLFSAKRTGCIMKLAHLQIEVALWWRSRWEDRRKWQAPRPASPDPHPAHVCVMRTIHTQFMNFNESFYESIHIYQQQQHSILSQTSWGRLEMKPKRDEKQEDT